MTTKSILGQNIIDALLQSARRQVEQDGSLRPVLYVHIAGDRVIEMPLMLPDTAEERSKYFFSLGRWLDERGLQPSEAVVLSESWFVSVREAPAALDIPPSRHPSRQEAIIAIGRRADGSRGSQVVQPFTRDKHNHPVWQAKVMADYDTPQRPRTSSAGLLDYFFEAVALNRR